MEINSEQFYANLPLQKMPLYKLLLKEALFQDVPPDWQVIITDIENSTTAVGSGQHENVNMIATGSIVAVMNIALANKMGIPFFFGGDGATFLLPPLLIKKVLPALLLYRARTLAQFNLHLRIGTVTVGDIYAKGYQLKLTKFCFSECFPLPVVLGAGLAYAESIIKGAAYQLEGHKEQLEELDLGGMQCRWDRIPPPEDKEEVVTLLVVVTEGVHQNRILSQVLQQLDRIYGSPKKRAPLSIAKLKLKTTFSRLGKEMKTRIGSIRLPGIFYQWFRMLLGVFWFKTKKGQVYLNSLIAMSDTLVIDGKINTVISGTVKQRELLKAKLDAMEKAGKIKYGMHISNASIMSCYVRDMKDDHIHFVDGAEGGYTQAAIALKAKLRQTTPDAHQIFASTCSAPVHSIPL